MKRAWERTAKLREALLAHRLRLEQAKASVQVVPSSIEYLASLVLTFECSRAPDGQLKRAEEHLDELFEYLSDTRQAAEELIDQVNSLIEDAELVHYRIEDVMAAEPLDISVEIQRAIDDESSFMGGDSDGPSSVEEFCSGGNFFKRTIH